MNQDHTPAALLQLRQRGAHGVERAEHVGVELTAPVGVGQRAGCDEPQRIAIHRIQRLGGRRRVLVLAGPGGWPAAAWAGIKQRLIDTGNTPRWETPEQFKATVKADRAKWAVVVRESGATVD